MVVSLSGALVRKGACVRSIHDGCANESILIGEEEGEEEQLLFRLKHQHAECHTMLPVLRRRAIVGTRLSARGFSLGHSFGDCIY